MLVGCVGYNKGIDIKDKATSFILLFKMIAKLEWTQDNAYQNKDKHRTATNNGKYI